MTSWLRRSSAGLLLGAAAGLIAALFLNLALSSAVSGLRLRLATQPQGLSVATESSAPPLDGVEESLRRALLKIALVFGAVVAAIVLVLRARHARDLASIRRGVTDAGAGRRPEDLPAGSPELREIQETLIGLADLVASQRQGSETARVLARTVFEEVPAGLIVVDPKLVILDANPTVVRLFGARTDVAKRALVDLVRQPAIVGLFERGIAKQMAPWEPDSALVRIDREVGDERAVEVTVRAVPNSGKPGEPAAVGVVLDVTDRERTDDMRKRFVGDVSHELRTPIASIRAAIDTLLPGENLTPEELRLAGIVERQAAHMADLVSDLMDLSQIETGAVTLHVEEVPIRQLLETVIKDLAGGAESRGIRVAVEGPDDLTVAADRRRMAQVFRNLIDNALKFSPPRARVDILIEGDALRSDGSWGRAVVHVIDRGIGIAKSEQQKIFQRFYRVDPSRTKSVPGTGLGLAIVKHLLILHGGTIRVESEPNTGSRFTVSLPVAFLDAAKIEEKA